MDFTSYKIFAFSLKNSNVKMNVGTILGNKLTV